MALLGMAVAAEQLEKDREDIRKDRYKNYDIYSGFIPFVVGFPKNERKLNK